MSSSAADFIRMYKDVLTNITQVRLHKFMAKYPSHSPAVGVTDLYFARPESLIHEAETQDDAYMDPQSLKSCFRAFA